MKYFLWISLIVVLGGALSAHAALTRTLRMGDRGADVKELQQILNRDPETQVAVSGSGAPGLESDYFGLRTFVAVQKFQQKYWAEILTPAGLLNPTGIVAARTIAKLVSLGYPSVSQPALPQQTSVPTLPVATKPVIASISPNTVTSVNQTIVISGSGFLPSGNTVMISSESQYGYSASSPDGTSMTISMPFALAGKIRSQIRHYEGTDQHATALAAIISSMTGSETVMQGGKKYIKIIIVVKNRNGESNPMPVLVDIAAVLQS